MPFELVFILGSLLSVGLTVLVLAGLFTYVTRTRQLMRSEREGSGQEQLLDGLDEIRIRLDAMSERLQRIERGLASGEEHDGGRAIEAPPEP